MKPPGFPHWRQAALTALTALTALVALAPHAPAQAQAQGAATVAASGDAIVFSGQLNQQSAAAFIRLLQDPGIQGLVITSRGGMVTAALDMAVAIHERQLDIEVPTACLSSYANYNFPAGRHKLLEWLKFICDVQTGGKDTENAVEDGIDPFFVRSQTVERIHSKTFDCEAVLTAGDGVGVGKVFHYVNGPFDFHQRV